MWIPNAISWWKINKAIDTVVSAAKWEQPHSLQKQPEDPTSLAYAAWEGLTRWVDQAAAVLTLTEAAKQLPKAAQKWWNKILNKVKDAKSKSDQIKLAKEAREYLNKAMDENLRPAVNSSAPSYQQRAVAIDNQMHWWNMRTYVDEATDNANKTFKNMTSKMNAANMSKDPAAVKMRTARNEVYPAITDYTKQPNKTYAPLKPAEAAEVFVPYKWSNLKDVQHMQERVNNIAKMSDTEFRKYMNSVERADMAGYWPDWYDYQIEDLWHSAWGNSKSLWNLKNQIINRITYSYDPEQFWKVSWKWQEIVKNNALKNNKVYRKRKVKDIKDKYDELTKWITRDQARDAKQRADEAAAAEAADIAAEEAAYKHEGNPALRF